ncbi:MAG: hypothetical protein CSYNP_01424 [Syntrophus sp. SKADARSKE-3]|nr:hypothetical protein [Syntrophus sp. SKADARSKE-3]
MNRPALFQTSIIIIVIWGLLSMQALFLSGSVDDCLALTPSEILVIANKNHPDSVPLAHYYMEKRGILLENLIILSLTTQERCRTQEYNNAIVDPLRFYLQLRKPSESHYRCIVTMLGVPLVISGHVSGLKNRLEEFLMISLRSVLLLCTKMVPWEDENTRYNLRVRIDRVERKIALLEQSAVLTAVDSEIALVRERRIPYFGWLPNPYYRAFEKKEKPDVPITAFMVSRLDSSTPQTVRRMIDDSIKAEMEGLRGIAYFDARWPFPGDKALSGYAYYDLSIHRAARQLKKQGFMEVVLDQKERLFQPGECPKAALYCGWYSLGKYIDAFQWVPGAVAYHIASNECQTLKDPSSTVWCKVMLDKGVAATIGPVDEPFVQAFPPPDLFFGLLMEGKLTLGECFAYSNPFLGWKMILIGDPLYRPFKRKATWGL